MHIQASNLIHALRIAIEQQSAQERRVGYTGDSALVAGWRDVKAALERGEQPTINPLEQFYVRENAAPAVDRPTPQ